ATTLAGTATKLTRPDIAATTGAVIKCAAAATATDSATPIGRPRLRSARTQPGAITTSAAEARTDIANDALPASVGCHTSNARAADHAPDPAGRWRQRAVPTGSSRRPAATTAASPRAQARCG